MSPKQKQKSIHALRATNFFLADVQTGLGPFLAAYLAGTGWNFGRVGVVLTVGGIVTVVLQTPAGAFVDRVQSIRMVLVVGSIALAAGALLLFSSVQPLVVYGSQILIGGAAPFRAPTLAAIAMGLLGHRFFDFQFRKNQAWNSAGNVACALVIAIISQVFGNRAIFITAAVLTVPTILSVLSIKGDEINYVLARAGCDKQIPSATSAHPLFAHWQEIACSSFSCFARFSSISQTRPCFPSLVRCCRTDRTRRLLPSCRPVSW